MEKAQYVFWLAKSKAPITVQRNVCRMYHKTLNRVPSILERPKGKVVREISKYLKERGVGGIYKYCPKNFGKKKKDEKFIK